MHDRRMQKFKIYISCFWILLILSSCGIQSRIKKADKAFASGEYFEAGNMYRNLYSRIPSKNKPEKSRMAFYQAECYRYLSNPRAEQAYSRAIRYEYPDSLVFLRYAQVLQKNVKYPLAIKYYKEYLLKDSTHLVSQNQIDFIHRIDSARNKITGYKVSRNKELNVRRSGAFSPVFSPVDEGLLFFTSSRKFVKDGKLKNSLITGLPENKLYFVKKDAQGKWEKVEVASEEINLNQYEIGAASFSPDGKNLYFTAASQDFKSSGGVTIMYSARAGGEWTEAKKINVFKDSTIVVAHPAIAPDGETIVFVSDAPGGYGGKDLWKAKLEGAECKFVENLGPVINTSEDELFPSFKFNGNLYFSSNGHPGFGGLDIYKAEMNKDSVWVVENMGTPLNSNSDDFGMGFEGLSEKGYFATNRGETRGYDVLWRFEKPELEFIVSGKVTDDKSVPIPDAVVRLVSNTGLNVRLQTRKDGTYKIKVDKDMDCVMLATSRGYLNNSASFQTQNLKESKKFELDFKLPAIYRPVQLTNIFFEFGKWDLTKNSEKGLQELVNLLKDNPNIVVEISAHTDFIGSDELNLSLSQKRAQSVVDYLITAGIKSTGLKSVGYGETKPIVVDELINKRYPFLELGKELNENYIVSLTPENQEIANQINRRTEFRVVKVNY